MAARGVCVLGGPSSGKSTYLGALSNAVRDGDTALFRESAMATDTSALHRLERPLESGRYPHRTKRGETARLRMMLEGQPPLPPETVELTIVDYAGEMVEMLFRDRTRGWTPDWQRRAEADGLLIFIRPPVVQPLPRLRRRPASSPFEATLSGPARIFGEGLRPDESPRAPTASPDDPVRMPTELALVELIQFFRFVRGLAPGERPDPSTWRIALMVSAWDDVSADWQTAGPRAYLEERCSLLEDYLWSNFHPAAIQRFGLSATGGDLNNDAQSQRYQDGDLEGYVTWDAGAARPRRSADVALPVAWSLFGDAALAERGG